MKSLTFLTSIATISLMIASTYAQHAGGHGGGGGGHGGGGGGFHGGGGGHPDGLGGNYVKPTIFANVTNNMTIARDEIFGPVISILTYENEEEAIAN